MAPLWLAVKSIEDLKGRSVWKNIILTFHPAVTDYHKAKDENRLALVKAFLHQVLVYIKSTHRLRKTAHGKTRSIIALISDTLTRSHIFNNVSRLRNTLQPNPVADASVTLRFALPGFKIQNADLKNKVLLRQGKIYVKNKLPDDRPVGPPPRHIIESREKKDSGHVFKGCCAKVTDIQDISQVIIYVVSNKLDVTKASHVIYAYRLNELKGERS